MIGPFIDGSHNRWNVCTDGIQNKIVAIYSFDILSMFFVPSEGPSFKGRNLLIWPFGCLSSFGSPTWIMSSLENDTYGQKNFDNAGIWNSPPQVKFSKCSI